MLVAAATVHAQRGFFMTAGGFEYNLILGMAGLSFAFTGPGAMSLDRVLGLHLAGLGWGLAAVVLALVGGGAQLAQRHEPHPASDSGRTADQEHGDMAPTGAARA